jgi:hypothetical protein
MLMYLPHSLWRHCRVIKSCAGMLMTGAVMMAAMGMLAASARANIVWNWSAAGGVHQGTFITTGSNTAPLAAGSYTITDGSYIVSSFMPLGSISGGQYVTSGAFGTGGPYTIGWNGSAVTSINSTTDAGVNGLTMNSPTDPAISSVFGSEDSGIKGPGRYVMSNDNVGGFARGNDLVTTPVLIPEPASLGMMVLGGVALLRRRAKKQG